MTNEELISEYRQSGSNECLSELYNNNKGLIYRWVEPYKNRRTDIDDLLQTAYFALLRAVEKYDSGLGFTFTTYLCRWVKSFAAGYRNDEPDMLSLDEPVAYESDTPLYDTIPDNNAVDIAEYAAEQDARNIVRKAVNRLPERERYVICGHFFQGKTFTELADDVHTSEMVRDMEHKALRSLRKDKQILSLRPPIRHVSLTEFRHTFTSSTEWSVLEMERNTDFLDSIKT